MSDEPVNGVSADHPATVRATLQDILDLEQIEVRTCLGRTRPTFLGSSVAKVAGQALVAAGRCLAVAARGEAAVLQLFAGGAHLADESVRAVFELVGPSHVALVTDAMAAAGMPGGPFGRGRGPRRHGPPGV